MFANRIGHQTLSTLCERVGVAFDVGLDPHRVFEREAKETGSGYSRRMRAVAEHVRKGGSLADAIKTQGNFFPDHFGEMIDAGEQTGRLDKVLDRLADYYQNLADFRSAFLSSILWPLVQLAIAALIVGGLIYLPSVLLPPDEAPDLLGLGLVGPRGLTIYLISVAVLVAVIFAFYLLAKNGAFRFLGDFATRVPKLGRRILVFAEARFVQTLSLAIESGMDASSAIDLAFRSAGTTRMEKKSAAAKEAIERGRDMCSVLADTGLFQEETLEAIQLGEESGRLSETLDKHFRHLKTQVKTSMATITYLSSAIIWFLIAAVLIAIIFRVFSLYIGGIAETGDSVISGAINP